MANNRVVLCGNVDHRNLPWEDQKLIHFRTSGPQWNIRPGLPKIRTNVLRDIPDRFADLLEIATYVYVADQVATRGGEGVDNVGEDWYRNFFFRVPVRHPEFWNSQKVVSALTKTLSFLSDDQYQFDFVPLVHPPQLQKYFDFGDDFFPLPHRPDLVMLFSGGLDSLAGAIQESIVNGRRVAMVMHRSTDKFITRVRSLQLGLKSRAAHEPLLFPVKINKRKEMNHEFTQRARSFLYVTLGALFAEMFELPEVRFYENGVVSLNLPIADQAVGTRSTRTTHPQVLNGFTEVVSLVADRLIEVKNPFIWKTKQDVVEIIKAAGCADMIRDSISCAHATWGVEEGKTHCGACSQCIDRRFAVLAAGLAAEDPLEQYSLDLLTSARSEEEPRLMLASYVLTAEEISAMHSPDEFFSKFGMACRALRCFPGRSPDSVAQDIYQLHLRHAKATMGVIHAAVADNVQGIVARRLDPNCLLRIVSDSGDLDQKAVVKAIEKAPLTENVLKKEGRAWRVRFAGGESFIAMPTKGMAYLHLLLSSPNKQVAATDLVKTVAGHAEDYQLGDAGEVLDDDAVAAYRAKLYEIDDVDLPKADKDNNAAKKDELIKERTWLEAELNRRGVKGTRREKDDRNRVRTRVANAIARAVEDQIRPDDACLADHLQKPRLQKGYSLCYMPGEEIRWELS